MYLLTEFNRLDSTDREIVQTFLDVDTMTLDRVVLRKIIQDESIDSPDSTRLLVTKTLKRQRQEKFFDTLRKNYTQQRRFFKNTDALRDIKDSAFIPIYEFGRALHTQQEIFEKNAGEKLPEVFYAICEETRNILDANNGSIHSIFANSGHYSRLLKNVFTGENATVSAFGTIDQYTLHGRHFYNELENALSWGLRSNLSAPRIFEILTNILAESMHLQGELHTYRENQTRLILTEPYLRLLESLDGQNRGEN